MLCKNVLIEQAHYYEADIFIYIYMYTCTNFNVLHKKVYKILHAGITKCMK